MFRFDMTLEMCLKSWAWHVITCHLLADAPLPHRRWRHLWTAPNWVTKSRKIVPKVGNESSLQGLLTGSWQNLELYGKNRIFGQKSSFRTRKNVHFLMDTMFWPWRGKVVQRNIARIANAVQVTIWLLITTPKCHDSSFAIYQKWSTVSLNHS